MTEFPPALSPDFSANLDALYRQVVATSPDGIVVADQQGAILTANPSFLRLVGYESLAALQASGQTAFDFIAPADTPRAAAGIQAVLASGQNRVAEYTLRRRDGSTVAVAVNTSPITGPDGAAQAMVSVVRDISTRQRAEAALQAAQERYRQLFDSMLDGYALHEIILDDTGQPVDYRFLDINAAFTQMTGLSRDIVGQTVLEVMPGTEPYWIETYGRVALTGETLRFENYSEEVGARWFDVVAFQPAPGQFAVVFQDVTTERRQAEAALREQEGQYRSLFEDSPISLWLEDFSAVRRYIDDLRAQSVTDLRAYFDTHHPQAARECAQRVRVVDVNRASLETFGAASKEELLLSLDKLFVDESFTVFREEVLALAAGEAVYECEIVGRPVRGEPIDCLVQVAIAPGYEQTWEKVFVSVIDITERKRMEAALRENEADLRSLFEDSPISLWQQDFAAVKTYLDDLRAAGQTDLRAYLTEHPEAVAHCATLVSIQDANRASLEIYGVASKEELLGSPKPLFVDDTFATFREEVLALAEGNQVFESEIMTQRPDGVLLSFLMRVALAPGYEATWGKVFVSIIDITARTRMEAALRLNEARLEALWELGQATDASSKTIADKALEYAVQLTNSNYGLLAFLDEAESIATMHAWSAQAMADCNIMDQSREFLIAETGIWGEVVRQREPLLLNDFTTPHDKKHGYPDEHLHITRYLSVPFFEGERVAGLVAVANKAEPYDESDMRQLRLLMSGMWDVMRRHEAQAALERMVEARTHALREAQERLVRQEKLAVLGQLAGGVGHELRNPLGVMSNAVYFLRMVLGDADATVLEYLDILNTEVATAGAIVSDLLNFSRARPPQVDRVSLALLLTEVLIKHPPPEGVTITQDLPPDLPDLFVDERQTGQVFTNLIVNACQAMPEGGVLTLRARPAEAAVVITIQDTGVGIPPENLRKIFEPLFTTRSKGIGLGLSVSRRMVENNSGTITVASEVGAGTTFTVTLPACGDP